MRTVIQKALRWHDRTKEEQEALHKRFDKYRYWFFFTVSQVICWLPIPLKYLFRFTLSDKHAPGKHQYGWAYQKNFWRFKYRPMKILEIGIGGYEFSLGGQSLNSWQSYFPFGKIVAADIKDSTALSNFRTKIYIVDQGDRESLIDMARKEYKFDIVVDDGSHFNHHQILTFHALYDFVKDGGIYVVEDVQTSYWQQGAWDGAEPESDAFAETCVGYFLRVAKYINHSEFRLGADKADPELIALAKKIKAIEFHHNLIFIHKGTNDDPSNAPFGDAA